MNFKNNSGAFMTNALFLEFSYDKLENVVYTLKDHDHEFNGVVYKSLRKIYMEYNHAPGYEYNFAVEHLGGWQHWVKICNNATLKPHIEEWREEMRIKLIATGVQAMTLKCVTEKGTQAARWLAENGYDDQVPKRSPGRPKSDRPAKEKQAEQEGRRHRVKDYLSRLEQLHDPEDATPQ
jgi:hypothetical protein